MLLVLFASHLSYAQVVRCYSDEMDLQLRNQFPQLESKEQFEHWLDSTVNSTSENRVIGGVYQIPVVFHIIHLNSEAVGVGSNISYAAIQSQLDVLNEDFRRQLGTRGYNTNPVGADTEIEFVMAKRRPDGSAFPVGSDGVNRINVTTAGFSAPPYATNYVDATIKTYTYNGGVATATRGWLPSKYMNIWICSLSGGILGYAQFPQSAIGGMGCTPVTTATDGVVFTSTSIGKSAVTGFPGPYNEGRTATHEIGHWLGLRHIWGDGNCTVDDFCNDTPEAGAANYGCPNGTNSCPTEPGNDMIENYMDYTDDLCMNIFTNDQKTRMRTVLESSPLRVSLINSDAGIAPNPNDASIIDILNPQGDNCVGSITPSVVIKNRGSNVLTSATITYKVDNGTQVNFSYTGSIAAGATATVALSSFTTYLGTHEFKAFCTLPNGVVDPSPLYDTTSINFVVSTGISAPYTQDFEANVFPPDLKWVVNNENSDCYEWLGASATSITGVANNNTAQFPGFGNNTTGRETLITPIFILPCNSSSANIQFDVAYRRLDLSTSDRLYVEISEDCGQTWNATAIYDKSGATLQVLAAQASYYTPIGITDWRTETINLTSFITSSSKNIKFRFRAVAGNGNNIYIDNFKFNAVTPAEILVSQNGIEVFDDGGFNFGNVNTGSTTQKTFTVKNTGSSNLTMSLPLSISGSVFTLANNLLTGTIAPGASQTFDLIFTPLALSNYSESISFTTNDCDEGAYNFLLIGTGSALPPVANFTADKTLTCTGSNITFTNTSTLANSYAWNFGVNAVPQTSTLANPIVYFTTNGAHDVTLVATNSHGSDSEIKTSFITTLNATSLALPLTEGFTGASFPVNWSIVNNNASSTWTRSATVGNAPTAGNSMMFNNFSINDADDDEMRLPGLNLGSVSSAQMTFDVAYAPYNGTFFDGLQVLVSTDCGSTFSSVYSKSNTTLATAAATTTAFVPTAAQWRTETIDLASFIGNPNVIIAIRNLSGNGQNLYVDNISVRTIPPPVSDFSASTTTTCTGTGITFTDLSTFSPNAWTWTFTGGSPASSSAQNPVVSYASPGTYAVTLTASNGAGTGSTMTKTAYITINSLATTATCSPTRSGAASYGITNVTLNSINNTTVLTDAVINDYSCSKTTSLAPSTLYNISVTVGTAGAHWLRAYIDYNNDGDFVDVGENIWSPANGTGTINGSFTVPASPTLNTTLRMRVIADRVTGGSVPGPCSAMTRGQAEDYGIKIVPPCTTPTITASAGDSRCGTGNVTFSATPSTGIINWYDASTGGNFVGTGANFVTSISTSTTYYAEAVNGACISVSRTAVLATVGACTNVQATQCGITLAGYNDRVWADEVLGATNYRFLISDGTITQTFTGPNRWFYFTWLTSGFKHNTTYTVQVSPEVAGVFNPYNNTCNVTTPLPTTQVQVSQWNTTLSAINAPITATSILNASGYKFEITENGNTTVYTSTSRTFTIPDCGSAIKYNTIYSIRVAVQVNGTIYGAWGTARIVTTPLAPLTKVQASQCGTTLAALNSGITADDIPYVSGYKFEIVDGANTQIYTSANRTFSLTAPGLTYKYGTAYTIRVATLSNGNYGTYGSPCVVTTPAAPLTKVQSSQCNTTLASMKTVVVANNVLTATAYRFKIQNGANTYFVTNPTRTMLMTQFASTINTTYDISVAVEINGVFQAYGTVCQITTPSTAIAREESDITILDDEFTLEAYPNPNNGEFTISSTHEGTFNLVNELGQLIQTIEITKENNFKAHVGMSRDTSRTLVPGIYFITGTINEKVVVNKIVIQ